MAKGNCSITGCATPVLARGWCRSHYERWSRTGSPVRVTPTRSEAFWGHVAKGEECWLWTGRIRPDGYGQFGNVLAHRFAYEDAVGPIPAGLTIDHVRARGCVSRSCQNPAHLEVVTRGENTRRASPSNHQRAKTHCPDGHPYDAANTLRPARGGRECRTCRRARHRVGRPILTSDSQPAQVQ